MFVSDVRSAMRDYKPENPMRTWTWVLSLILCSPMLLVSGNARRTFWVGIQPGQKRQVIGKTLYLLVSPFLLWFLLSFWAGHHTLRL